MIRRPTEEDRDRLADAVVHLSYVVRMAEDAVVLSRARKIDPATLAPAKRDNIDKATKTAIGMVNRGRDSLAEILSWVAARHPEAYALAQMRLMELTAEEITKEHARRIIDELADMRDVVTDLGELS